MKEGPSGPFFMGLFLARSKRLATIYFIFIA